MANLDNITDVFAGASIVSNDLVIPTGQLPRFNQGDAVAEGAEVVYALLAAMHTAVNAAGNENTSLSASVNNTFNAAALTMNRSFTFSTTLDVSAKLNDFDVKLDTVNKSQNLSVTSSNLSGGGSNVDVAGTLDKSSDGATSRLARLDLSVDGAATDYAARYTYTIVDSVSADNTAGVSSRFEVTNDGTDWFVSVISGQLGSISEEAHNLTVSVDDNTVDFAQEGGATSVSVSVTAQA